jgi:hypothetical protein
VSVVCDAQNCFHAIQGSGSSCFSNR